MFLCKDDDFQLSASDPQFSLRARAPPLSGVSIAVAANDGRDWVAVLQAAGAKARCDLEGNPAFLLCSATHHSQKSFEMCERAYKMGIRLLSFAWLFECLALQCMRQPQPHHSLKVPPPVSKQKQKSKTKYPNSNSYRT